MRVQAGLVSSWRRALRRWKVCRPSRPPAPPSRPPSRVEGVPDLADLTNGSFNLATGIGARLSADWQEHLARA